MCINLYGLKDLLFVKCHLLFTRNITFEETKILDISGNVQNPQDLLQYITKDMETRESCCSLCTFRNKIPAKVKNHLEGVHFPGVFIYSCDKCNKTFKGRNALGVHQSKVHSRNAPNYY